MKAFNENKRVYNELLFCLKNQKDFARTKKGLAN